MSTQNAGSTVPLVSRPDRSADSIPQASGHIRRIDGLRAVAVLAVLVFHLRPESLTGGYVGVDVFFVVSGFLISRKILVDLEQKKFSFREFYVARIRRIFPALFVTLAVTLGFGSFALPPLALHEVAKEALSAAFSVSNILFWRSADYFDAESSTKALLHTWSLGVEEQYYLVLPLAMFLFLRRNPRRFSLLFMGVAFAIGLVASQLMVQFDSAASFFLFPFRIFQFALGGLLATWFVRHRGGLSAVTSNAYLREGIPLTAMIFIGIACVRYTDLTPFAGLNALLPSLGAAGIIYGDDSFLSRVTLENGLARFVGKVSYSLYLVHWPIIVFWKYLRDVDTLDPVTAIGLGLASVAVGYGMFRFVETPFRAKGDNAQYKVTPRVLLGLASFVGVGIAGASMYLLSSNGSISSDAANPEYAAIVEIVGDPKDFHLNFYGGKDCVGSAGCETHPGLPIQAILAGDSHAGSLVFGVRNVYPDTNTKVFAIPGCPIFSFDHWALGQSDEEDCKEGQSSVIDVARTARPDVLMLHESWQKYMVEDFGSSRDARAEAIAEEVAAFASQVGAARTIVIGGVPASGSVRSPLDCLAMSGEDCYSTDRGAVKIQRRDETNDLLSAGLSKIDPSILFVDPFDVLCDASECENFTPDGMPIYSDVGHLSTWGSEYVVSQLREELGLDG